MLLSDLSKQWFLSVVGKKKKKNTASPSPRAGEGKKKGRGSQYLMNRHNRRLAGREGQELLRPVLGGGGEGKRTEGDAF